MKRLFDDNGKYTAPALELEDVVRDRLKGLFKNYGTLGYTAREIAHVMNLAVHDLECETVLKQQVAARRPDDPTS